MKLITKSNKNELIYLLNMFDLYEDEEHIYVEILDNQSISGNNIKDLNRLFSNVELFVDDNHTLFLKCKKQFF